MKYKNLNSGQMLIEIIVALGIIALVLVGVSDLMTRSARLVTFQKQKNEAMGVIQKILNDYRVLRDTNPVSFYDGAANRVIDPCVSGKTYVCQITMDKLPDSVYITVKVSWPDGGKTLDLSLSQSLARNLK